MMLRRAMLALCLCRETWAARPPPDAFWQEPGAAYDLSKADSCLPPGGTAVQGKPPIKLLMVPTAKEMTYMMAILLRERLVSSCSTTTADNSTHTVHPPPSYAGPSSGADQPTW